MINFTEDIKIFENKIRNKEHFAFSKYADGELRILIDSPIDILNKCHGEFKYDPKDSSDTLYREKMLESFKYIHNDYYVGIGCPCCIGKESFEWMKNESGQPNENLTWANLWVNANYSYYKENILPLYNKYKVVMVCNKKSNIKYLPFHVEKDFRIGTNAWKENYDLIKEISSYILNNNIENYLFLFCAGPLGNMLCHQLHKISNKNTYLDIGSTLDPFLFGKDGLTRGYHQGLSTINKVCVWG